MRELRIGIRRHAVAPRAVIHIQFRARHHRLFVRRQWILHVARAAIRRRVHRRHGGVLLKLARLLVRVEAQVAVLHVEVQPASREQQRHNESQYEVFHSRWMLSRSLSGPYFTVESRLYFVKTSLNLSCGSACTVWPSAPVMVLAATIAFTTASSVAWIVASKSASIWSPGSICTATGLSATPAPGFAVENAMKMSPELSPEILPSRPRPSVTRLAMRFSSCGKSGASVATTTMIEPVSFLRLEPSEIS